MAEIFYPEPQKKINLHSFIDFIEHHKDIIDNLNQGIYNRDEMMLVSEKLAELSRNESIVTSFLAKEIKDFSNFQKNNDFKPLTITLFESSNYMIRALIWFPPGSMYPPEAFFYYEPHDHNFDFFTVGHFGGGYSTSLYEYNHAQVKGVEGEKVYLNYIKDTTLSKGKVMYYYGSKDVHIQLPPSDISISLNLVMTKHVSAKNRQYKFHLDKYHVSSEAILEGGRISRLKQNEAIYSAALYSGNLGLIDFIKEISAEHKYSSVKQSAKNLLNRHELKTPKE